MDITTGTAELRPRRWFRSRFGLMRFAVTFACVIVVAVGFVHAVPSDRHSKKLSKLRHGSGVDRTQPKYQGKKLLLILLDGFRWDYVDRYGDLAGFNRLRREGVYSEYSVPVFPSMTLPNMYSIATGLYPESHGILDNYMHDRKTNNTFEVGPVDVNVTGTWWDDAEPLWITATKAGLKTHLYLWYGCEFKIRGHRPTNCIPYSEVLGAFKFREYVYDILDKFEHDEADLGMLYVEDTDFVGHVFGPRTQMMNLAVHDVDSVIDRLLFRIEEKGLQDKINVIVMSDHGMTPSDMKTVKKLRISDYVNMDDVEMILSAGAMMSIIAKKNRIKAVYNSLKGATEFNVWLANELPENFHFKHHRLVPDIVIVAKRGFAMVAVIGTEKQVPYISIPIPFDFTEGNHGYLTDDFPDMRGILYGWGPDMAINRVVPPTRTLDVYNLASHLLGISPLPNNGSWEAVKSMLKRDDVTDNRQSYSKSPMFRSNCSLIFCVLSCLVSYRIYYLSF